MDEWVLMSPAFAKVRGTKRAGPIVKDPCHGLFKGLQTYIKSGEAKTSSNFFVRIAKQSPAYGLMMSVCLSVRQHFGWPLCLSLFSVILIRTDSIPCMGIDLNEISLNTTFPCDPDLYFSCSRSLNILQYITCRLTFAFKFVLSGSSLILLPLLWPWLCPFRFQGQTVS